MKKLLLLGLTLALFSAANLEAKTSRKSNSQSSSGAFELNVAHINDHHSHLEEEKMPLKLNGKTVTVHIGGLPRVAQAIKNFRQNNKNTLEYEVLKIVLSEKNRLFLKREYTYTEKDYQRAK